MQTAASYRRAGVKGNPSLLTVADWIEEAADSLRPPEVTGFSSKVRLAAGRLSLSIDREGFALSAAVVVKTWLILPVVICLSQRLSHACLSMNFYTVKLRMAH